MPDENNNTEISVSIEVGHEVQGVEEVQEPYCQCADCGDDIMDENDANFCNDDDSRCQNCYDDYESQRDDDESGDIPYRDYDTKKYIFRTKSNKGTAILQSTRGFGVELECLGDSFSGVVRTVNDLESIIGVSRDGSINGSFGFELQLPLVNGLEAERLVNNTCDTLRDYKNSVDDSCGYHIHLQSLRSERNHAFIQRLMFTTMIFDDVIKSLIPAKRSKNHYCKSIRNYMDIDNIVNSYNIELLEQLWYRDYNKRNIKRRKSNKYDEARYFGFNFHCYFAKSKHLEVRYHSGTINAEKILHWANLHTLLLDYVKKEVESEKNIKLWKSKDYLISLYDTTFGGQDISEKTKIFFELIGLSDNSKQYFINRQSKLNN